MTDLFRLLKPPQGHESIAQLRIGTVASCDTETATARVLLQPEAVLTGWLPLLTHWAGPGWGMFCPPGQGDQVIVLPQEGDPQCGIIIGRIFSNQIRPPATVQGEITIAHQSGSSVRLLNSGIIAMQGDLHVSGDVYDSRGSLAKLRNDYNAHIHHTVNGPDTSTPLTVD